MRALSTFFLILIAAHAVAAPSSFEEAKADLRKYVYHDQNGGAALGTAYCGCHWEWAGRSGGRIDPSRCGLLKRSDETRAFRLEWEHVVPAHTFGQQRACWRQGGRKLCTKDDPVFGAMEADMHNLVPAEGEVNSDRSNFRYGMLPATPKRYGVCETKVDFNERVAEPRNAVKGQFARITFYMYDRYELRMSDQQQLLLMAWDRMYPVTPWERELDRRVSAQMGHHNPFVTGERAWTRGHRNSREGIVTPIPQDHPARILKAPSGASASPSSRPLGGQDVIVGNANSKVYHLPVGCPSYAAVGERNRVTFVSEEQAIAAGFRRAGNCRN